MNELNEFGIRLELIRNACGFKTQRQFADFLGATKSRYGNWIHSENGMPIEFAKKIKDKFGFSLDYIYCGDISSLSLRLVKLLGEGSSSDI